MNHSLQRSHDDDGGSPGGFFPGSWRTIEPVYLWSALIGLVVALLLIGFGVMLQTHALH